MNVENLSHAYIISAMPEEGLKKAMELAAAMLCERGNGHACGECRHCRKVLKGTHPDIMLYERPTDDKGKPKREIPVDRIREIGSGLAVMPNEAERRVYILRDAGAMNTAAQNALLKMLEEPPRFVAFILITDNPRLLLDTVVSRCVMINLKGEEELIPAEARQRAEKYLEAAASGDELALLSFCNENGDMSNMQCSEFAASALMLLTDMLCGRLPDMKMQRKDMMRLASLMEKAQEYLRFNVSTKHVLGLLSVRTIESK